MDMLLRKRRRRYEEDHSVNMEVIHYENGKIYIRERIVQVIKEFGKNHRIPTINPKDLADITCQVNKSIASLRESKVIEYYKDSKGDITVPLGDVCISRSKATFTITRIQLKKTEKRSEIDFYVKSNYPRQETVETE